MVIQHNICVSVCKKVETLQTQIITHTTEVKTSHKELSELKKTYQSLEIKLQSALSEVGHR